MNRDQSFHPLIGEVYWMRFDGNGSEMSGTFPGVVFQNNVGNAFSPCIVALPLCRNRKTQHLPTHVEVSAEKSGLRHDSVVLAESPRTIDKTYVGNYITKLPDETMKNVAVASLLASSCIAYLDEEMIRNTFAEARRLNEDSIGSSPC